MRQVFLSAADDDAALTCILALLPSLRTTGDERGFVFAAEQAAMLAEGLRRYELASQLFEEAVLLRPSDAFLLLGLAQALEGEGRTEATIAAFERCAVYMPEADPELAVAVNERLKRLRGG